MQRNSISMLQSTTLALLDVESRDHEDAEPCLWALLCRSIAIGESAGTFSRAGAEQLMMSPKGMNAVLQTTASVEASRNLDTMSWSPNQVLNIPKTDANSLVSAAVAAQVDIWRTTKASVGNLVALMPPLARQVRHFAVECVLRVFELMAAIPPLTIGVSQNKQLHFDLAAARRYFCEMLSAEAELPVSAKSNLGNFLCMYLDEFVTLACHVTTTSAEGNELLMFQCVGLRLLNVLVKNFASARDPEVAAGDAYLLDPYRAQLLSAVRHALKQVQVEPTVLTRTMPDARDDERTAIVTSPLVKAMKSGLCGTTEYLFKCWMDVTIGYGVVMQGCVHWAQLDATSSAALLTGEVIVMPALQMPLPPPTGAEPVLSTSKKLSALYKRYWPKIVNAMAILEVFMPKSISVCSSPESNVPKWSSMLLSCAICHINANACDRMEDEGELPAILRSIPLLLRAIVENPSTQGGSSSSNFPLLLTAALDALVLASKRCSGPARVAALSAIFSCLSRETLTFARQICRSREDGQQLYATLFDTVTQTGLCPTEVVCQLFDATEQTRHACAVSTRSRTEGPRRSSVATDEDAKYMTEIVQFATTGIVLLHKTEGARSEVVRSVAMVQQVICFVAADYYHSSVKEAVVTLSRASAESVLALARTLEENDDPSDDVLNRVNSSVRSFFEFLSGWLKSDGHLAPGYWVQIVANYAANFPASLQADAECFHAGTAEIISTIFELLSGDVDDGDQKQQHAATCADLLRGLHTLVKRLIDVHQTPILNRYLVALGPYLVEIVGSINGYPETAAELTQLDEAEKLLRVLTMQLDDQHGSTFVQMLLPRLAAVLSQPTTSATDNMVSKQVPGILARLLLCFAQTQASAFKEAVAAMTPLLRGVLETTLRITLTDSVKGAGIRAPSSLSQGGGPTTTKLDLSRYA
ncbi:unnamed protein product [Peronospora destructor]|uniref:Exportin-1/Importin-beta-like domain-containing protein n=1 Tax=Peronospora destructor TaxID=86335 RepID=A0AAV0TZL3_9STRA|nr:unnamed protein product [Peronospora destructor]